jgi:hypothetical protein
VTRVESRQKHCQVALFSEATGRVWQHERSKLLLQATTAELINPLAYKASTSCGKSIPRNFFWLEPLFISKAQPPTHH